MAYEELFEAAGANPAQSDWEAALDDEERELLPLFEDFLREVEGKAESTAKAYRGYVAQAMGKLRRGEDYKSLTTDVRSGVNAFIRFSGFLQLVTDLDAASGADEEG